MFVLPMRSNENLEWTCGWFITCVEILHARDVWPEGERHSRAHTGKQETPQSTTAIKSLYQHSLIQYQVIDV